MARRSDQPKPPLAVDVSVTHHTLFVTLADGRHISVPLNWLPRLSNATRRQREQWKLIDGGASIRWELIGEDVTVESLLAMM